MSGASEPEPAAPIAIVGIGCRYPGARGPEELWRVARDGEFTVRDVPEHRVEFGFDIQRFHDDRARIPGRISSIKAGFIDHPEEFDPLPFGLTPRDAAALEPQARMAFEVVWDAIVDAGLPFESLRGERVAMILGHTAEDFSRERIAVMGEDAAMRALDVRSAVGFAKAAVSGRISHQLDLRGPSLTIDTACSSSLYATHLACHSIWRGESKLAFAGGLNLFLTPEGSLALSRSGMMAADGKCKAFDERADGFVRAEGAGVVLLRPLADAIENGDRVYAVIRGTGISADGRDGGHMMAPGREGQAQAMHDAYRMAALSPSEIDFVETHGTGTVVGDPIEIGALADVMGPGRDPARPLRVSSIKGNIGHAESASGAAGLIKAALAVHHRTLPAQLHFEVPSTRIPWDEIPIQVQRETEPWPHDGVARVGVNSFGISGTNAHVIVETAPPHAVTKPDDAARPRLVALSTHEPAALRESAAEHLEWIRAGAIDSADAFDDLAYTLGRRRSHLNERAAFLVDSPASLARELEGFAAQASGAERFRGQASDAKRHPLVFVFPGQGGQWIGMARDLVQTSSAFRREIDDWTDRFGAHVDWSLRDVLLADAEADPFRSLAVLQPTLVVTQIAIADWLALHGVVPDAVLGQSVGEVAAAAVAGALDRDDIARLVCSRGAAVQRVAGKGAMGLIGLPEAETREAIAGFDGVIEVAGQNGLSSTLIAGNRAPLVEIVARLEDEGVFARVLDVDFASHCFHMDLVLDEFATAIAGITPRASETRFISSVTSDEFACDALDVDYWVQNLRRPVRFADALKRIFAQDAPTLVEVSPHPSLGHAISEVAAEQQSQVTSLSTLRREQAGETCLLRTLGELFVRGYPVAMDRLHDDARVISTPLYPYQKQTLWFGERRRRDVRIATHPLLGVEREDSESGARVHEAVLDLDTTPSLAFAERNAHLRVPAGVAFEIALSASASAGGGQRLSDLRFAHSPVASAISTSDARWRVQTRIDRDDRVSVVARSNDAETARWEPVLEAAIQRDEAVHANRCEIDLDAVRERCTPFDPDLARNLLAQAGTPPPRKLDGMRELHTGDRELLVRMTLPAKCQNEVGHFALNPVFFETAVALAGTLLAPVGGGPLPSRVGGVEFASAAHEEVLCHASLDRDARCLALTFLQPTGEPCARIDGVETRPHPAAAKTSIEIAEAPDRRSRADGNAERIRFSMESGTGSEHFVAWREPASRTLDDEVTVAIRAAAFSRSERLRLHTADARNEELGCEFAGVVTRVGSDAGDLRVGDRVMGLASGSMASAITLPSDALVAMPTGISFDRAATLPFVLATAQRAVNELAAPGPEARVLVLGGDDELARAIMGFALASGADVVGCPNDPASIAAELASLQAAEHIDLVLSTSGSHNAAAIRERLSATATWIDLAPHPPHPTIDLGANRAFLRVDIEALLREAPEAVGPLLGRAFEATKDFDGTSQLAPRPVAFPAREIARAFRFAAQRRAHQPVVVRFDEDLELDGLELRDREFQFDREASHRLVVETERDAVIAGAWLARRGARQLSIELSGSSLEEKNRIEAGLANHDAHVEWTDIDRDSIGSITCVVRDPAAFERLAEGSNHGPLIVIHERGDTLPDSAVRTLCDEVRAAGRTAASLGIDASAFQTPANVRRIESTLDHLLHGGRGLDARFESAPLPNASSTPATAEGAHNLHDRAAVYALFEERVASVLALSDDARGRLVDDTPLNDIGLDSLLARELALQLETLAGVSFEPALWADRPSLATLVDVAADKLGVAGNA